MAKAQLIRQSLAQHEQLIMPGVYDALSAKIAARAGFEVIVDADTGYGNAINVMRTVQDLIRAGAGGMFLEDQVWPKRCGHMKGKQVIPLDEQLKKLNAAIEARGKDDFFIVARTDSRQALGLEEAIRRGIAFKQTGADAVFIEAPESKEEMKEISRNVTGPLVANMLERGVTPLMGPKELKELGFQLVVWPLAPLYSAAKSLTEVYTTLRRDGSTIGILDRLMPFDDFNSIVGLNEKYDLDAKYKT
jgi:methylisocitrate lyase